MKDYFVAKAHDLPAAVYRRVEADLGLLVGYSEDSTAGPSSARVFGPEHAATFFSRRPDAERWLKGATLEAGIDDALADRSAAQVKARSTEQAVLVAHDRLRKLIEGRNRFLAEAEVQWAQSAKQGDDA